MRLNNCFKIVVSEIKSSKGIFSFYLAIFICLISIGTSMLDVSFYLPKRISASIRQMDLDWMMVNIRNIKQLDMITSAYDIECIDVYVDEFHNETLGLPSINAELYSGGVVLNTPQMKDTLKIRINENLLCGERMELSKSSLQEESWVYISQRIAEEQKCRIGQSFQMVGRAGEVIEELEIKGIYKASEELNDYYMNQTAYEKYKEMYQNCAFTITMRNATFEDIFSFTAWVEANRIECDYSKDMIGAIQMFYILFIAFNFILLVALSGVLFHLLDMYMLHRVVFYAVGSAIGMTSKDIMHIIYILSELLISVAMLLSGVGSVILLKSINEVAEELFSLPNEMYIPVIALLINWGLLQVCVFIVIERFRKNLERKEIISVLRCE